MRSPDQVTGPRDRVVRRQQLEGAAEPVGGSFPWRLTRRLGGGAKLILFRAAARGDLGPGCYVLKTMHGGRESDAVALAMLRREAVVAEGVSHSRLTAVMSSEFDGPRPSLLLPYFEGVTLERLAGFARQLSIGYVLSVVRHVAGALAALHAGGWLHGLVRPGHVIVSPQGEATLIDLTEARRLESSECDGGDLVAADRNVCFTYAAPEMFGARGRLTAAADTYCLGLVLFELLAGRPAFAGSSRRQVIVDQRRKAPPDLRQMRPGISMEVAELVRRMLAKEPLRRPSDEELVQWLMEVEIGELAA